MDIKINKGLVGIPITFLLLALFSGGFANAWQILSISIVCTAGISLIIWIPLFWAVGWLTFEIYGLISKLIGQRTAPQEVAEIDSQQVSLIKYIEKCNRQGWSETQIISRLRAHGWSDEEIIEAQNIVRNRFPQG